MRIRFWARQLQLSEKHPFIRFSKAYILHNRFKGAKIVFAGIVAWSYFVPTKDTLLFFDRMAVICRRAALDWQLNVVGLTICRC
jgi:hypothetical protein